MQVAFLVDRIHIYVVSRSRLCVGGFTLSSTSIGWTPKKGSVAQPGFMAHAPGNPVIRIEPVSVCHTCEGLSTEGQTECNAHTGMAQISWGEPTCHQVSTIGQRPSPTFCTETPCQEYPRGSTQHAARSGRFSLCCAQASHTARAGGVAVESPVLCAHGAYLEVPVPGCCPDGLPHCPQDLQGGAVVLLHPLLAMRLQRSDQGGAAVKLPHL